MDNNFLSIITINYNNGIGLKKTIDSVKSQTSINYEHIIIDGNSSDESINILKDALYDANYEKHVTFWCSEKDKGVYDAMNKGIQHANGKFCLFLNSGDYLADNKSIQRLETYDLTDDSIIYTNAIYFNKKNEWKVVFPEKLTPFFFYQRKTLSHQNMLFPTQYIKNNPYSLEYKVASDVDLYLKAFFVDNLRFIHLNEIISKYENETGISSQAGSLLLNQEWDIQLKKYIPEMYRDLLSDYYIYENNYHGLLRKIKHLLQSYTRIKKRIKK